jgi:hypothetical protein
MNRREFMAQLPAVGLSASAALAIVAGANAAPAPSNVVTFRVTGYSIHLGDKLLITVAGQPIASRALLINCTGDNNEQLDLHFLSKERPGDANDSDKHGNTTTLTAQRTVGAMFLPVQQYTWYVDLLRNEDPVWATLDGSLPLNNRLWCGERVGEGDLRELVS